MKEIDYDSPRSIVKGVSNITTPVGFLSMDGNTAEHNFRHIHSLMEYQMKLAFQGWNKIINNSYHEKHDKHDSILDGWKDIVKAAKKKCK